MHNFKLIRHFSIMLCFFCTAPIFSQNFTGVITDDSGNPIEFATIYIEETSCGTHTNTNGQFSIDCKLPRNAPTSFLSASYLGYKSQQISIENFQNGDTIILRSSSIELALVEVVDRQNIDLEAYQFKYDIKKPYFYYQTNVVSNHQLASRIANEEQKTGYLSELKFKIGRVADTETPTRVLFYDIDTSCNCPGNLLHTKDILFELKRGSNKINLQDYAIKIPSTDFYIVFEWLHNTGKTAKKLDFSIGMIPFRSEDLLLERKGGLAWQKVSRSSQSRVWTQIKVLVERK